jgi:hypothetical protein
MRIDALDSSTTLQAMRAVAGIQAAKWLLNYLVAVSLLSACATTQQASWTTDDLVGRRLELVDSNKVETMRFAKEGHVALTVGKKDAWLTGPVFSWQVKDGRLQIFDGDGRLHEELTLVSQANSQVVARRRSGEIVTYKRS